MSLRTAIAKIKASPPKNRQAVQASNQEEYDAIRHSWALEDAIRTVNARVNYIADQLSDDKKPAEVKQTSQAKQQNVRYVKYEADCKVRRDALHAEYCEESDRICESKDQYIEKLVAIADKQRVVSAALMEKNIKGPHAILMQRLTVARNEFAKPFGLSYKNLMKRFENLAVAANFFLASENREDIEESELIKAEDQLDKNRDFIERFQLAVEKYSLVVDQLETNYNSEIDPFKAEWDKRSKAILAKLKERCAVAREECEQKRAAAYQLYSERVSAWDNACHDHWDNASDVSQISPPLDFG